jgi:hypothetical protein
VKPAKPPKAPKLPKPGVFDFIEPLPRDAWGATRVAREVATSDDAATLLGLGYPNMFVPSSEPFAGTDDELRDLVPNRVIPRNSLERLFRYYTTSSNIKPELAPIVDTMLASGTTLIVWIVEAMFGSVATAEQFVKTLEALPDKEWTATNLLETNGWSVLRGVAWVLYRVPPDVRTALRGRLAAIFERVDQQSRPGKTLDVMLHGRAGVERSGRRAGGELQFSELLFADDDPVWVAQIVIDRLAKMRASDREQFNAQLAVIGGPAVLAALREAQKKFSSDQRKAMTTQLALFAGGAGPPT